MRSESSSPRPYCFQNERRGSGRTTPLLLARDAPSGNSTMLKLEIATAESANFGFARKGPRFGWAGLIGQTAHLHPRSLFSG